MKNTKTIKIECENSFHNTKCYVLAVPANEYENQVAALNKRQYKSMMNKLCPNYGCSCGGFVSFGVYSIDEHNDEYIVSCYE